jgi:hypothetical protein
MQQSSVVGRTSSRTGQGYCELQQLRCLEGHAATRIRGAGAVASYAQAHEAAIPDIVMMWWNCHFNRRLLRYMVLPAVCLPLTMPSSIALSGCAGGPAHLCIRRPHAYRRKSVELQLLLLPGIWRCSSSASVGTARPMTPSRTDDDWQVRSTARETWSVDGGAENCRRAAIGLTWPDTREPRVSPSAA